VRKFTIKKYLLSKSIKYPLLFFLIILIIFYLYTFFHPIPTPHHTNVGIGSNYLDIGDRTFYFNEKSNSYGFKNGSIKGSFLYPFILNLLASITSKLGLGNIAWNMAVIFMASLSAITSLFFIDKSANIIFGEKIASIASWFFVLCPYTIFYCLSGGITIYVTLGVSFVTYTILKSNIFNPSKNGFKIPLTMFLLLISVLFLSSIRVTGAIFSMCVIVVLIITIYRKSILQIIKLSKEDKLIIYSVFSFCLAYCFYQIKLNLNYLSFSLDSFVSYGGSFFGFERQFLRDKLQSNLFEGLNTIKSYFYLVLWKISDFVSGLSDIRNSHTTNMISFFPFISRIFVGLFIIYPINIMAFFGIIIYWKRIYYSGLWISLFAAFLCLIPSFIGFPLARYLIMVYPPFIIISAKVFGSIIDEYNHQMRKEIT